MRWLRFAFRSKNRLITNFRRYNFTWTQNFVRQNFVCMSMPIQIHMYMNYSGKLLRLLVRASLRLRTICRRVPGISHVNVLVSAPNISLTLYLIRARVAWKRTSSSFVAKVLRQQVSSRPKSICMDKSQWYSSSTRHHISLSRTRFPCFSFD